jgi:uncharacterized membrane protein
MSVELVVATFEGDENKADEVLKYLDKLEADGILQLEHVAVVTKTDQGEVQVKDVGDVDAKHGTLFGAITGGLIGLLGGPVGVVVGATAGAATGRVTANLADYGVSDNIIDAIEEGLIPGSSAIIAYVELDWASTLIDELNSAGGTVINQPLRGDMLSQ